MEKCDPMSSSRNNNYICYILHGISIFPIRINLFFFQRFLRKGKAGGYRDDLNDHQIQKIDEWITNGLKGTDFRFKI